MTHIVILGGGPAGYVGALHAAAAGARVTLIEAGGLGGTCLHRGCIPTKTLVSACSLLDKIRRAADFGIRVEGTIIPQWSDLQSNVFRVVETMEQGVDGLLADRDVEVISGFGEVVNNRTVRVANYGTVTGDYLLLCTGSKPARPRTFPFDGQRVLTSDELFHWETLPRSLAIIGESIVACEFAFIFDSLGVEVTVVGMEPRPAPLLDADLSTLIAREMRKKGIEFSGGAPVEKLVVDGEQVRVLQAGQEVCCSERALVCVGRVPNTQGLNLEAVGVKIGARAEILVDEFMQTSAPGIYAAGDVTGRMMLAHAASAQARLAVDHMLGRSPEALDDTAIPWAIFTSPEIGCVGLTEEAARQRGFEVSCGKFDMRGLGKAQAMGELSGMVKVVADAQSKRLLGVHIMGAHASDMIHQAVVLLKQGARVDDLLGAIHAHPTLSEAVAEAAEDVFGQAIHKTLKAPLTRNGKDKAA